MPELPEVETVRCGLLALIGDNCQFQHMRMFNRSLRTPVPKSLNQVFFKSQLVTIERRAKYLIWHTTTGAMLNHLGMTGSWRLLDQDGRRKHDHCVVHCADGRLLAYNDPRRFGLLDILPENWQNDKRMRQLGPEPLDEKTFTASYLHQRCSKRSGAIKHVIMDQKIVVGVGNIYAAESLFAAGISPKCSANRISHKRLTALVDSIRVILAAAIQAGGSTISDFRQAGGGEGYFQHNFHVYGREGEPCSKCQRPLRNDVIGGRASVWCSRCQR
ncbi:MAG: bifunctional DNA-formamidopyrimidine glycosylase/DNA-(apurinic or apyrimidinic site) lyase [Planctomycetes bacterium]|nr:bifunctional DNA-formamidopyrimidine glycosylase/DNA-(apurinic or apyrimidinic site) lyase [Planctomycetota bacterium]